MRLFLWFAALSLLFLITYLIWGGGWEQNFGFEQGIAWLRSAGDWAWLAGIGLLMADIFLPVPGTVVMSVLGYIYGAWLGGLIAALGSMAAGLTGYGIGRCLGERTARKLLGDFDYEKGRLLFARGGGWKGKNLALAGLQPQNLPGHCHRELRPALEEAAGPFHILQ